MRRIQSLFKTLLMLIPMTAVPVMAIFGIPQFFPVSASPTARTLDSTGTGQRLECRVGQSDALLVRNVTTGHPLSVDLFEPYDNGVSARPTGSGDVVANAASSELTRRRLLWRDPLAGSANTRTEVSLRTTSTGTPPGIGHQRSKPVAAATARQQVDEIRPSKTPSFAGQAAIPPRSAPSTTRHFPASAESTGETDFSRLSIPSAEKAATPETAIARDGNAGRYSRPTSDGHAMSSPTRSRQAKVLTWQQAVDRLNQLGIRTFRLTPDTGQSGYRFVCLVTSVDDPRISRRFEAESVDPLVAVGDVLAQVENWNLDR